MSQDINLTAGHSYIIMSNDSATAELIDTTLSIDNAGKIDVTDLGVGTRGDGPCVLLVSTDGPKYIAPPVPKYWAVDIANSTDDPDTRCTYPQTITVNNKTVDNACYGYTPMRGSTAGTFTDGSWANEEIVTSIKPVSFDGTTWTDLGTNASQWSNNSEGTDYFTEFPFYWLSITNDGTRIRIIFSDADTQPDSTFQCYAHAKGCDSYSNSQIESAVSSASRYSIMKNNNNSYFANAFHVGCFYASGTDAGLYSRMVNDYPARLVYTNSFKGANARGVDYDIYSFQQYTYIQALFILIFKSTNSQSHHSYGVVASNGIQKMNGLSTNQFGMAGATYNNNSRNAFFWIHDIWGSLYGIIGGAWVRAGTQRKMCYWLPRQANSRAFTNGWTAATTTATQSGLGTQSSESSSLSSGSYISGVSGTNLYGFLPMTSSSSSSSSSYYCDTGCLYAASDSAYFAKIGGGYSAGTVAGIFYTQFVWLSTNSLGDTSARLTYRGGH